MYSRKDRKFFLFIVASLFITHFVLSQDDPKLHEIVNRLEQYSKKCKRQKAYLHIDKSKYRAGEIIFAKAYLVDAVTLKPDTVSNHIYIQLINYLNSVIVTKRLKLVNGMATGDILLTENTDDGVYKLRAFTGLMRNYSENNFFETYIRIVNTDKTIFSKADYQYHKTEIRQYDKRKRLVKVEFFPEGGTIISGIQSKIVFKATNFNNLPVHISGYIIDNEGNKVALIETNQFGYGTFTLQPDETKPYKAKITLPSGKNKNYELPDTQKHGTILKIDNQQSGKIKICIRKNQPATNDPVRNTYYLIGQTRGKAYFAKSYFLKNDSIIEELSPDVFPEGIAQFTLFNGNSMPISERLVYINRNKQLLINIKPGKNIYSTKDSIKVSLGALANKKLTKSNLSLSVVNKTWQYLHNTNIYSNLLFISDIQILIPSFDSISSRELQKYHDEIDELLLTQKWLHFDWNQLIHPTSVFALKYPVEQGIQISGHVTKNFFDIPGVSTVTLSILNEYNDQWTTKTDENGYFIFSNLDYNDTIAARLDAVNMSDKQKGLFVFDKIPKPTSEFKVKNEISDELLSTKGKYGNVLHDGLKHGSKETNNRNSIFGKADYVLYLDEIHYDKYYDIFELIRKEAPVSGISLNSSLLLIDDRKTYPDLLKSLNMDHVERIEIVKNSHATSMYEAKASKGVISVYTKYGSSMEKGMIEFEMLGYSTPTKFEKRQQIQSYQANQQITYYWIPEITTNSKTPTEIEFPAPGTPGYYTITVQGISSEGIVGCANYSFEVK